MKLFFIATACLFFTLMVHAQYKFDYIWLMGDPTDNPNSNGGVNVFDFNGDTLSINKQQKGLRLFLTNASISNHEGELLFYTNGCNINNAQHNLMQNGGGLNPGFAYLSGNCPDYGNTIPKGILVLPLPNSDSKYYVFHQSLIDGVGPHVYIGDLFYSLVDMSLANGLGAVVNKNQVVVADTFYSDLHAIKHANGEDWWIITSKENSKLVYKILFTEAGVSQIDTQTIGIPLDDWTNRSGMASFSPDGSKFARYSQREQVTLFDFDRSTGQLSNFQQLYADTTIGFWGGLSFSPNSRFLYANTQAKLWQFDLLAPDVEASKVLIDEWDGFTNNGGHPITFWLMQLAPDCKIYIMSPNSSKYMHVINRPDEPGLACDFQQRGLLLPANNQSTIPNFPNYRLGTGYPVCDSNIVYVSSTGGFALPPVQSVQVWPNPASGQVSVSLELPLPKPSTWHLLDPLGREVVRAVLPAGQQAVEAGLAGVPPGMYFWNVESEGRPVGSGKLIIQK